MLADAIEQLEVSNAALAQALDLIDRLRDRLAERDAVDPGRMPTRAEIGVLTTTSRSHA